VTNVSGWLLVAAFALWNGWALVTMARHRTALLPGGATRTVIDSGPFARSRNPLYLGLLAGSAGVALLAASLWALVALPLEWALLRWGAVGPEEHYLAAKFGASYADYTSRVPRWL
jgi:protein-S-isoprenylcysteine O-methyltransferase Ste14